MTAIATVTTEKYSVRVEADSTVTIIGNLTSAASAAASAATAGAAAGTATTQAGLASGYATDAQSYMTSALGYRNDAQTAAGTATTQAGLASGYTTDAQSYMTTALGYRNDAQTAAGTATTQAGLASGYATDAQSYMTSALGYRNDAQAAAAAAAAAAVIEIAAGTHPASFTTLKVSEYVALAATKKLYLDGIAATGDTYLVESSADVLDAYVGGANALRLTGATLSGPNFTAGNAGSTCFGLVNSALGRADANYALQQSAGGTTYLGAPSGQSVNLYVAAVTRLRASEAGVGIPATSKLSMDGIAATGDTYLVESSANVLDLYAGGAKALSLTATGAAVTGTLSATGVASITDITEATSTAAASLKTAGGLGVAKSLRVGLDTYTSGTYYASGGNNTLALRSTNVSTGYTAIQLANSGGNATFGMENSTGGNNLIVGASGYDTIVRGPSGIAFSANNGANMQMRLSSTGLAVTGTLSATGTISHDVAGVDANLKLGTQGSLPGIWSINDAGSAYTDLRIDGAVVRINSYSGGSTAVTGTLSTTGSGTFRASGNGFNNGSLLLQNSDNSAQVWSISNLVGSVRIGYNNGADNTVGNFSSTGLAVTGTLTTSGALSALGGTFTAPLKAQYGYYTVEPCLSVGADIAATTITNATRKYAVVSSPHFTSGTVMPSTIFRADSTDASNNDLAIGGGAGAFTAFKTTTFYAAANNTTLGGNIIATISNNGFAVSATNKLYLDGAGGVGGDTYLVESSANILDLYTGGTRAARFGASSVTFGAAIDVPYSVFNTAGSGASKVAYFTSANSIFYSGTAAFFVNDSANTKNLIKISNTAPDLALSITSTGTALLATQKLYLDGVAGAGGDTYIVESAANVLDMYAGGTKTLSLTTSGVTITGTISTTNPAGGAGPAWKFGVAATVSPTAPDRTLRVDIAGTSYYLAAKTTND